MALGAAAATARSGRHWEVAGGRRFVVKMLCGTDVSTHIRWGRRRGLWLAGGRVRAVARCRQGLRLEITAMTRPIPDSLVKLILCQEGGYRGGAS